MSSKDNTFTVLDKVQKDITNQGINESFEKGGKGLPIGTVRKHGGKQVVKTAQGWKPKGGDKKNDSEQAFQIGDKVEVPRNLTTDPAKKQGQSGEVNSVRDGVVSVKFSDGSVGRYQTDALQKISSSNKDKPNLALPMSGKVYQINTQGQGDFKSVIIEAKDGSHHVDMRFDSKEEAQKYIDKHNFPTDSKSEKKTETVQTTDGPKERSKEFLDKRDEILDSKGSKSDKARQLADIGESTSRIAKMLNMHYSHAYSATKKKNSKKS